MRATCVDNIDFEDRLIQGKTYVVLDVIDDEPFKFFRVKDENGIEGSFYSTRFEVCETVDNFASPDPVEMSLWDSMEQIEGLDRSTAKSFTYKMMLSGSNPIELAKEYKLSLAQVSQIVLVFNTYTGYED